MKLEAAKTGRMELHEAICIALGPLPVWFISTVGPDGVYNAAPYSFVAPLGSKPAIVVVSFGLRNGQKKDTLKNIEYSHDFVINSVDEALLPQAVHASADYAYSVDEIKMTGLTAVKSDVVKSPRISEAKVSLECKLLQKLELIEHYKDTVGLRGIVIGEVAMIHIKDEYWVDGKIDARKLGNVARIASNAYVTHGKYIELKPPKV